MNNKRKREEEKAQEKLEQIETKQQKLGKVLRTYAQELEEGKVIIQKASEIEAIVTNEVIERIWELPLEEAVCKWIGRDKKALEAMETVPSLRNYRLPEEILLKLKDKNTINGNSNIFNILFSIILIFIVDNSWCDIVHTLHLASNASLHHIRLKRRELNGEMPTKPTPGKRGYQYEDLMAYLQWLLKREPPKNSTTSPIAI